MVKLRIDVGTSLIHEVYVEQYYCHSVHESTCVMLRSGICRQTAPLKLQSLLYLGWIYALNRSGAGFGRCPAVQLTSHGWASNGRPVKPLVK
jgi:hypothetical protein